MALPDYQALMLPLLRLAGDDQEHKVRDAIEALAAEFNLSKAERSEMLPSGGQAVFDNRVGWARTYMKQAGLLDATKRGYFRITSRGRALLASNPPKIDTSVLAQYEEFQAFVGKAKQKAAAPSPGKDIVGESTESPEDLLAHAYKTIRQELEEELIELVKSASPAFFERLVVDLLVRMGYGGSRQDAGQAIGGSGDEGIDGIIKEDKLGLDVIYLQAKRWKDTVSRPEIQKFAGALQGQRARKGVFITTSSFTREAREYAAKIESRLILIDGLQLASLMVEHGVGVSLVGVYEVKKIDSDYFEG